MKVATAYRQCRVTYAPFADDFIARKGEDDVDRDAVLQALTDFLEANNLKTDWEGIESAPNEALVNALAMMSPYGSAEKQAIAGSAESQDPGGNSGRGDRDRTCKKQGTGRNPSAMNKASGARRLTLNNNAAGSVDPKLLEILVCPLTKGPLEYDAAKQELISRTAKLAYPIRDGIPIMLPEEARRHRLSFPFPQNQKQIGSEPC